ncbi:MAG: putative lipid II flippase FtsW [Patescibacteria group bacterium]|jgi:cell division protein FtsW
MPGAIFIKRILTSRSGEHEPDKNILMALGILVVFGLVMLFSASSVVSYARFGNTYHYFLRQLMSVGLGVLVFWLASKIDYHLWRKFASFFLFFSIALLVLVFIPGLRSEYGTARSWINIFGYSFQPAELVKISFLIYLATWLEAKRGSLGSFGSGLLPFLMSLGVISLLMLAQPDLGTLFIIIFAAFVVFFAGGGKVAHIIMMALLAGLLVYIALSLHSSYQSDRFKCLKDPNYSAQDKCYQINQSLIAIGSGGWFGRGLGESRQKFMYLPEVWGDSIFPIIAEETGFVFSLLLILLYLFLFYRGLLVARGAPDIYGSMLAIGIVAWLAVQTFLNIGGMVNLIPMTGVPLPFVSSGGSAILSSLLAMGILVNISKQTKGLGRERR